MDTEKIISLKDSCEKIEIEHHFKVNAGPGAGKTTWLVNHIKNVIQHSYRLGHIKKIACITYTNTASEKILYALAEAAESVEVSTIHAFLYKNIVKPYISFLDLPELNIEKIKGHDEYIPNKSILYNVKSESKQLYIEDKDLLDALMDLQWKFDALMDLQCKFDANNILQITPRKYTNLK